MCVYIEKILTYGNEKIFSYHGCLRAAALHAMSKEVVIYRFSHYCLDLCDMLFPPLFDSGRKGFL